MRLKDKEQAIENQIIWAHKILNDIITLNDGEISCRKQCKS